MKLPPALFSTTTVVFMLSAIFCATSRAVDVGAAAGRETDDHADRLARKILRLAPAPAQPARREQEAGRSEPSSAKDVMAFLPNFYGLMFASLVILV